MVKTKIERKKMDIYSSPIKEKTIHQTYTEICPNNEYLAYNCSYLTSDEYNRHIYFLRGVDSDGENLLGYYVVLFNSDGTYNVDTGVMEITDLNDYKSELKEFKERNNWNNP